MYKKDFTLSGLGAYGNLFRISGNCFILNDFRIWPFTHLNHAGHTVIHGFRLPQEFVTNMMLHLLKVETDCQNGRF